MSKSEPNRWKGFVLGIMGAVPGMMAMDYYWNVVYSMKSSSQSSSSSSNGSSGSQSSESTQSQTSQQQQRIRYIISPFGRHFEKGESSTAAMGRIIYQRITGKEPQSEETRTLLSNLTDWGFGMLMGGVYGALRGGKKVFNFKGELIYASALWLSADEIGVPLMGLAKGPRGYPISIHAEDLGAHLVYGLVTFTTTKILERIL